ADIGLLKRILAVHTLSKNIEEAAGASLDERVVPILQKAKEDPESADIGLLKQILAKLQGQPETTTGTAEAESSAKERLLKEQQATEALQKARGLATKAREEAHGKRANLNQKLNPFPSADDSQLQAQLKVLQEAEKADTPEAIDAKIKSAQQAL